MRARLAPDMYTLAQQVQLACDHAKDGVSRLMGKEPPRVESNEKTFDDLKSRLAKTVEHLKSADDAPSKTLKIATSAFGFRTTW
ncbi:MAG TPA: DUF1993 family protein [Candidatus Binataceae bacterium]